ncbi:MAG: alanine:cation symporter family protein [Fibrobacteraceae bacterium]|nr:alanine:cation symporter family protein [Fibrobacteraceae bacterium]
MDFNGILDTIDGYVWGIPLIAIVLCTGLLLTFRLKLLQVFHLPKALKFMVSNEEDGEGEVSSFGALCTALSATVGTGNIVGVATAICLGGPGALFWMDVAAFLGIATKYAEGVLAVKYRTLDSRGKVLGGPFNYIEMGIKERFGKNVKWMAVVFAVFGTLAGLMGIGTITQVNGITTALNSMIPSSELFVLAGNSISYTTAITGAIVTVLVALVILGGLRRIAKVTTIIVPFMILAYVGSCLILLICNITEIPAAIATICKSAFNGGALAGGAMGTIFVAMQKGIARGIFSNEAGLGSAPIATAAAKTKEPVRQGLVCMTGTFIDTIIVCTMTGLAVVITQAWVQSDAAGNALEGAAVTMYAFAHGLPFAKVVSELILCCSLAAFAFTTILGWNYYSEKCLQYLLGGKRIGATIAFRWVYVLAVFIGPYLTVSAVWTMADIFNGLMAFPNLIALILLSGIVGRETKKYFDKHHSKK